MLEGENNLAYVISHAIVIFPGQAEPRSGKG